MQLSRLSQPKTDAILGFPTPHLGEHMELLGFECLPSDIRY